MKDRRKLTRCRCGWTGLCIPVVRNERVRYECRVCASEIDVSTLSLGDRHRTRFNVTKIPATGALGVTLVTRNKKHAVTMLLTAAQHERLLRFLTNTPIFKEATP